MTTRASLTELIESRSLGGLCAVDPYWPSAPGGISAWDMQQIFEDARAVLTEAIASGATDQAFDYFNNIIDRSFSVCDAIEAD